MSDLIQPGVPQSVTFIAIAILLPIACVLVGLVFSRGLQLAQRKRQAMMLVLGLLCFAFYALMGALTLKGTNNVFKSSGYWVLAVAWVVFGVISYRAKAKEPLRTK